MIRFKNDLTKNSYSIHDLVDYNQKKYVYSVNRLRTIFMNFLFQVELCEAQVQKLYIFFLQISQNNILGILNRDNPTNLKQGEVLTVFL